MFGQSLFNFVVYKLLQVILLLLSFIPFQVDIDLDVDFIQVASWFSDQTLWLGKVLSNSPFISAVNSGGNYQINPKRGV